MGQDNAIQQEDGKRKRLPLTVEEQRQATRGWRQLHGHETGREMQQIVQLGLQTAVGEGRFRAYRWSGETEIDTEILAIPSDLTIGAFLYEVRGPNGAVDGFNLYKGDQKEEIIAGSVAASCSRNFHQPEAEIWVTGNITGHQLMEIVDPDLAVQGIPDEGTPHTGHLHGFQRHIYIAARNREQRRKWQRLARKFNCRVTLVNFKDLTCLISSDSGEAEVRKRFADLLHTSEKEPVTEVWVDDQHGYAVEHGRTLALSIRKQGEAEWVEKEVLAEFTARITQQRRVTSGEDSDQDEQEFVIEGTGPSGRRFPAITVNIAQFYEMTWALKLWGAQAVIHAKYGTKPRIATAILMLSNANGYADTIVYRNLGFIRHPEYGWIFLSPGAVIGASGAVPDIVVQPKNRLADYQLPPPPLPEEVTEYVEASLTLLNLAPPMVAFPTLAAMFRAPLGQVDTVLILVGETGRHKTAYLALVFGHYGAKFNRKHLPEGWGSSGVGLETVAYHAKDVVLVIDDLKLPKDRAGRAEIMKAARRIIASAADGVGRTTLTQDRQIRLNTYPRGFIVMSAEEVPDGESTVARALIIPVSAPLQGPDNILRPAYNDAAKLASSGVYAKTMSAYLQFVAQHHDEVTVGSERYRQHIIDHEGLFPGRHPRTGPACAELSYGWRLFLDFCVERRAISVGKAEELWEGCVTALQDVAAHQGAFVEVENPVIRFESLVNTLFSQRRIHLIDRRTGGVPQHDPELVGWKKAGDDYFTTTGSVMVGWVDKKGGRLWGYFLRPALYEALQVMSFRQGHSLPTEMGLWRALRDNYHKANLMLCDPEKGEGGASKTIRTTKKVRIICDNRDENVLALSLPVGIAVKNIGKSGIKEENSTSETEENDIPLPFPAEISGGISGITSVPSQ